MQCTVPTVRGNAFFSPTQTNTSPFLRSLSSLCQARLNPSPTTISTGRKRKPAMRLPTTGQYMKPSRPSAFLSPCQSRTRRLRPSFSRSGVLDVQPPCSRGPHGAPIRLCTGCCRRSAAALSATQREEAQHVGPQWVPHQEAHLSTLGVAQNSVGFARVRGVGKAPCCIESSTVYGVASYRERPIPRPPLSVRPK